MGSKHVLRYQGLPTIDAKSRHKSSILLSRVPPAQPRHPHRSARVVFHGCASDCYLIVQYPTTGQYLPGSTLDDNHHQLAPGNNLSTANEHRVLRTPRRSHLTSFTRMYLPPRRVSSRVRIAVFMSSRDRYSTTPEGQPTREKHSKLG